eukprot:scaffold3659_cov51-Phaeocystis_antarctica.AAC.2
MASKVASLRPPADEYKRSGKKLDHVASVRTRGGFPWAARPANMMVQQPSKMAHAREQWSGMARLNGDRTILSRGSHLVRPSLPGVHSFLRALRRSPLGVWVGEGLKEEIAGERGP